MSTSNRLFQAALKARYLLAVLAVTVGLPVLTFLSLLGYETMWERL